MTDKRVQKYAEVLVDHSARITTGDREEALTFEYAQRPVTVQAGPA